MARNGKMSSCFTQHKLAHTLLGIGIGFLLAAIFPSLASFWLGVVVIIIALVWDYARKK